VSDPATGHMAVEAETGEAGGELVVWTPTARGPEHSLFVENLVDVVEHPVEGGRIITARVAAPGAYSLAVAPGDDEPIDPTEPTDTTHPGPGGVAVPATPVRGPARFTG